MNDPIQTPLTHLPRFLMPSDQSVGKDKQTNIHHNPKVEYIQPTSDNIRAFVQAIGDVNLHQSAISPTEFRQGLGQFITAIAQAQTRNLNRRRGDSHA